VVSSDVASYQRGSTGEQTQGAGAVAFLVSAAPALLEVDLGASASASDYRVFDFRKPFKRYLRGPFQINGHVHDYPVFNGRYSTACFVDEVRHAIGELTRKQGVGVAQLLDQVSAIFMHRPYHRMPLDALGVIYAVGLAQDPSRRNELDALCARAGADPARVIDEAARSFDMLERVLAGEVGVSAFPETSRVAKELRSNAPYREGVLPKIALGADVMREMGNLYTAALPAWIAAGLEEAQARGVDLGGRQVLAVGYGSGNAAEALIMRVAAGWREAAARVGAVASLADAVTVSREQYEQLHSGSWPAERPPTAGPWEFHLERVGETASEAFNDVGIDYYRFVRRGG